MNRLIDKMDTITAINDYYDMAKYKGAQFTEKQLLNVIIGIITSQPTAYDVEAVVREITAIGQRFCDSIKCNEFCKNEMTVCDHAAIIGAILDVVERGGRNE